MSEDVYTKLREFLDKMPGGYPVTDTGVEIKILKKLFTPEQAELTVHLTSMPEPVSAIAARVGKDEAELGEKLEDMAKEGLIYRLRSGDQVLYLAVSFVVGIYEFHLNTIDREFSEYMEAYFPYVAEAWKNVKTKQLRVVPIHSSVDEDRSVSTYDRVRELVKDKELIAVGPCICQKEQVILGKSCDRPSERCIQFDLAAQYFIENGMSRQINQDELMNLLKMGEEKALVLCPTNAKDIVNICMCCRCCCNFLKVLKTYDRPADHIQTPFVARIDPETCVSCGMCQERCQMDAILQGEEAYEVDGARCIGCGLCVPECPETAISMKDKPDVDQPPTDLVDMNIRIAMERGVA